MVQLRWLSYSRCSLFLSPGGTHMSDLNPPAGSDLGISKQTTKNYARYVFWGMFLISFLNYMDRYILNGAATVVAHELGFGIDGIAYTALAFLGLYSLATGTLGI